MMTRDSGLHFWATLYLATLCDHNFKPARIVFWLHRHRNGSAILHTPPLIHGMQHFTGCESIGASAMQSGVGVMSTQWRRNVSKSDTKLANISAVAYTYESLMYRAGNLSFREVICYEIVIAWTSW